MSYKNKKVERWTSEEYEEFWSNFVEEITEYRCTICGRPIDNTFGDFTGHMESKHSEYYDKHNKRVKKKKAEAGRKGGKKSRPKRPEKKLTSLSKQNEEGEASK